MCYRNLIALTRCLTILSRTRVNETSLNAVFAAAEEVLSLLAHQGRRGLALEARVELLNLLQSGLRQIQLCINHHADRFPHYGTYGVRLLRSGLQFLIDDYMPLAVLEEDKDQWQTFLSRTDVAKLDRGLADFEPADWMNEDNLPPSHWWFA